MFDLRLGLGLVLASGVLVACSDADTVSTPSPSEASSSVEFAPAPGVGDDGAGDVGAADVAAVEAAVVEVRTVGDYVDPASGRRAGPTGVGSGFVLADPAVIVTNHHVVTGASSLTVFSEGRERPATLVAAAECADLAVLTSPLVDEVEGLAWAETELAQGDTVTAVGVPAGTGEVTRVGGKVLDLSPASTSWAVIEALVNHDGVARPGTSGGPLLDSLGRVVGVNQAGTVGVEGSVAIAAGAARPVIEALAAGRGEPEVGINGQAVIEDDRQGVWVSAVAPGSVADRAGIRPGDLVLRAEGVAMADDGSLGAWCEVLGRRLERPLAVDVLRTSTGELLRGALRGEPLAVVAVADPASTVPPPARVRVSDPDGLISVEVPAEWDEVSWTGDQEQAPTAALELRAAPDLAAFELDGGGAGVSIRVTDADLELDADEVLDALPVPEGCESLGRDDYGARGWWGRLAVHGECASGGAVYQLAVRPESGAYRLVLVVRLAGGSDLDALAAVLGSFRVEL